MRITLQNRSHRRAVVLIEALIFVVISTMIAVFALRTMGDSRVLRSLSNSRMDLVPIAQEQLDQLVASPSVLDAGETILTDDEWPSGTTATITIEPFNERLWTVEVAVVRETVHGPVDMILNTLVLRGTVK